MVVLAGRANKPRWGQWNCQEIGRLSCAPDKTAMLRRLGRGRWKISQNRIMNRKFRLQSARWPLKRTFKHLYQFQSSRSQWGEFVTSCLHHWISQCDSMQSFNVQCAFRPWHHNSVHAYISLYSGLFKLSLTHIVKLSRGRCFENLVALFVDCHLCTDTAIQFSSGSH